MTTVIVKAEEEKTNGVEKAESSMMEDTNTDQDNTVQENADDEADDEESMDGTDTESIDSGSSATKKMARRCFYFIYKSCVLPYVDLYMTVCLYVCKP